MIHTVPIVAERLLLWVMPAALDELMAVAVVLKNHLRGEDTPVRQCNFHATTARLHATVPCTTDLLFARIRPTNSTMANR